MRIATVANRAALRAIILKIVARQFTVEAEAVRPGANIFIDLSDCGFGPIELTMAIEDAFDLEISDTDQAALRTVDDVTDYMADRLGLSSEGPVASDGFARGGSPCSSS